MAERKCQHTNTHPYEGNPWPDGCDIEVCDNCGMSRSIWEQGESGWALVPDLDGAKRHLERCLEDLQPPKRVPMLNPTPYEAEVGDALTMVVRPVEPQPQTTYGLGDDTLYFVMRTEDNNFYFLRRAEFIEEEAPFQPGDLLPNGKPIVRVGVKRSYDFTLSERSLAGLLPIKPDQTFYEKMHVCLTRWDAQFPDYPWGSNPWCWWAEA